MENKVFILHNDELKFKYIIKSNGTIINMDTNKTLKHYKDPRRPSEPPIIYFKLKENLNKKRVFHYVDKLICETFVDDFDKNKNSIIHKNGNIEDCDLKNLYIVRNENVFKDIYNDNKKWCKVQVPNNLYYNYYICEDGRLYNASTNKFIKPLKDTRPDKYHNGYLRYNLYTNNKCSDQIHVSAGRLVAIHFLPTVENKNIVIYKDNDWTNICVDNLYWGDNWDSLMKGLETNRDKNILNVTLLGKEKWKKMKYFDIQFTDKYSISNYGRIYNDTRKFMLTQFNSSSVNKNNQSYKYVSLNIYDVGFKSISVHRLVAYNFVKNKNPTGYNIVNHINGNPECNIWLNLEWTSAFGNIYHAIHTNLRRSTLFNKSNNDNIWRFMNFIAWCNNTMGIDIYNLYNLYTLYENKYNDIMLELTFNDFSKLINDIKDDEDYLSINMFYKEYLS